LIFAIFSIFAGSSCGATGVMRIGNPDPDIRARADRARRS
jgi:hypothetical protein